MSFTGCFLDSKRPPVNDDIIYEYDEFIIVGKKGVVEGINLLWK